MNTRDAMSLMRAAMVAMIEGGMDMEQATEAFRKGYAKTALDLNKGHRSKAARHIHIHRNTLTRIFPECTTRRPTMKRAHLSKRVPRA